MRICGLSDLHITDDHRFDDQRRVFDAWTTAAIAQRPDLWIIGGDCLGHTPGKSTPPERQYLYGLVARLAEHAPVAVVQGNHDRAHDIEVMASLGGEWPIRVVTELTDPSDFAFTITTRSGPAHLYCLPWPTKRHLLAGEDAPRGIAATNAAVQEALGGVFASWAMRIRRARQRAPGEPHIGVGHLAVGGAAMSGGEVVSGQDIEVSRHQLESIGVDYGWLGHLHGAQEPADRWHYPGTLTRSDFGETEAKSWRVADLGAPGPDGRLALTIDTRPTGCRELLTLRWRWAADTEDGAPRWTVHPSAAELARVRGAEVRAIVTMPEAWAPSCPWAEEVARVRKAGAWRITEERKTEPTLRVRAPAVAAAFSDEERLVAYWGTLATPPTDAERAAALGCLAELQSTDDETIGAATAAL